VEPDESSDIAAEKGLFQRSVAPVSHPTQSSSASRFTAAQVGFFILSQSGERPERSAPPRSSRPKLPPAAGGKGGGHHGHWGHGYWGGGFGSIVVIGPSCWRWVPGLGRVYVCY
jgi:hypothetical protein